jgi:hypothetical protein
MRDDLHDPDSVLNYALPEMQTGPARYWIPAFFLVVTAIGEFQVVRLSRWPWPMPEDYALGGLLIAGAAITSLFSRVPGWAIGVYGLAGICLFWDGQFAHRSMRFGIGQPDAMEAFAARWIAAMVAVWAVCRATVLLRLLRRPVGR